jgi:hypothetical protein
MAVFVAVVVYVLASVCVKVRVAVIGTVTPRNVPTTVELVVLVVVTVPAQRGGGSVSTPEMVDVEHSFRVMTAPLGRLTTAPRAACEQKSWLVSASSMGDCPLAPSVPSVPLTVVTANVDGGRARQTMAHPRARARVRLRVVMGQFLQDYQ